MSKKDRPTVRDPGDDSTVPFLRGILTRSLQSAGLPFAEAYRIAADVRDEIGDQEVTSRQLRKMVAATLESEALIEVKDRYLRPASARAALYVRDSSGTATPFSKTILGQSLEICAVPRDDLYRIAAAVERALILSKEVTVDSEEVTRVTYQTICERLGPEKGARYLRWQEFTNTGRPLIIMLGGTTGCGKSTISALLAHRLGIVRTQSTDMLREVMRQMIPPALLPPLHQSSFMAHSVLPRWGEEDEDRAEPHMIDGYLLQAEEVGVGVAGVFQRAVREQVSLILEGVHMHPQFQKSMARAEGAIVVPIVLATLGRKALRRQLTGRGRRVSARRTDRYMEHFELIWKLQSFLLSEADRHEVSIVANEDMDESVRQIMQAIGERLSREYAGTLDSLHASTLPEQEPVVEDS